MNNNEKVNLDKAIADAKAQHEIWLDSRTQEAIANKTKELFITRMNVENNFKESMSQLNARLNNVAADDEYLVAQMKQFLSDLFAKEQAFAKEHLNMVNSKRINSVILGKYIIPFVNFNNIGSHASLYFQQAKQYRQEILDNMQETYAISEKIKQASSPELEAQYLENISRCHEFAQLYNGTPIMGTREPENSGLMLGYMAHKINESIEWINDHNQQFEKNTRKPSLSANGVEVYNSEGSPVMQATLDEESNPIFKVEEPITDYAIILIAKAVIKSSDYSSNVYSIAGGAPKDIVRVLRQLEKEFQLLPKEKRANGDMTIDIEHLLNLAKNADEEQLQVIFEFLKRSRDDAQFKTLLLSHLQEGSATNPTLRTKVNSVLNNMGITINEFKNAPSGPNNNVEEELNMDLGNKMRNIHTQTTNARKTVPASDRNTGNKPQGASYVAQQYDKIITQAMGHGFVDQELITSLTANQAKQILEFAKRDFQSPENFQYLNPILLAMKNSVHADKVLYIKGDNDVYSHDIARDNKGKMELYNIASPNDNTLRQLSTEQLSQMIFNTIQSKQQANILPFIDTRTIYQKLSSIYKHEINTGQNHDFYNKIRKSLKPALGDKLVKAIDTQIKKESLPKPPQGPSNRQLVRKRSDDGNSP